MLALILELPWGEKARFVLIHLNAEAVRTSSPEINVEDSMNAFVASLGLATHGRDVRTIKD
ncbi:MAG: replication protein RepA [Candidatus Eremiobacteraeota bacterium]|nr:replication protein RepA [Candidatus Eremiobacteraeota bacterium]